jgi:acyl-homoserine-lactone acylase
MSGRDLSPWRGVLISHWLALVPLAAMLALGGCSSDSNNSSIPPPVTPPPVTPPPVKPPPPDYVNAPATGPVATIRRTASGVPHIKADNLESATFGSGYVQAQDNICLLADAFVKARSERAKYFGPGPGSIHIINDFSYKAQGIQSGAAAELATLSPESRAMLRGFVAGYNKYVEETNPAEFPAECRNGPWVVPISEEDLLAHYRIVAGFASGDAFATGAMFVAVPPGVDPNPVPVAATAANTQKLRQLRETATFARAGAAERRDYADIGLASNAWGIGADLSENGRGALLANPHFPYSGVRRFYESQVTVPGYMNFHGAGLTGTPTPLIGFNENLGWSHTVSTSARFTLYELRLKAGDNLTYIKDGQERPITQQTFQIQVNTGGPTPLTLQKTFYYSEYGPMLAAELVTQGGLPAWGATGRAYSYRDANADTRNLLDTWLQMARATNLDEFQDVFRNCGSTLWVNTTYADDQGNAYYIDSSSVPNLSVAGVASVRTKLALSAAYRSLFGAGLVLLDGSSSLEDWVEGTCRGLVPFEGHPKLERADFVQNSNDSYWATNPAAPLEGFSPLFGLERTAQGPRTRIGLFMLQNPTNPGYAAEAPAGQDGKFGAADLARVLHNNRAWYAEEFLTELRARCDAIGSNPVNLPAGGARTVDAACNVLKNNWNGVYDLDSVGAHVFRVFIADYRNKFASQLTVPFNPADPVGTPGVPAPADPANLASDPMLQSLAVGLDRLDSVGIGYAAMLGSVQAFQPSGGAPPGGTAVTLGPAFPWHGGQGEIDGAFNAVRTVDSPVQQDTRLPRLNPEAIPSTAGLSTTPGEGWPIAYGTSWHFGLEFTDNGPRAFGLLSYSQSSNAASPFFSDQQQRYSDKNMRSIPFTEAEIAASLLPQGEVTISAN